MTEQLPAIVNPARITARLRAAHPVPALIAESGERASLRFLEFFAANIRNPHTRRAYGRAVAEFLAGCDDNDVPSVAAVQPLHVAAWIELQQQKRAAPTVKARLAAIRHLFEGLVTVPAHADRQHRGDRVDGLQLRTDRCGARVEDVFTQNRRLWVRLREKGGKPHAMPCHHNLETYLTAYIEGAGLAEDPKGRLFRTIGRDKGRPLTHTPRPQANAYAMIGRRALAAGIATKLGNHSFRATGITAYLKNGGTLEKAAQMANHASTRTTQLYDRRREASFGLDARIENYHGKRPIGLYSWDFECLLAVIDHALKDGKMYPDKTTSEYNALTQLSGRLLDEYHKAFGK